MNPQPGSAAVHLRLYRRIDGLRQKLEQRQREGKPVVIQIMCLIGWVVATVMNLVNPYQPSSWSLLLFGSGTMVLLIGMYWGISAFVALNGSLLIALIHLVNVCLHSGGIYSPRVVWLLLAPIAAFYSEGERSGRFWLVVSLLIAMGMALGTRYGVGGNDFHLGRQHATATLLNYMLASVVIMLVPWLYDHKSQRQLQLSRQRQSELQAKQVELEHTMQMREHFIASVSHELRTPMNAILGLNSVLLGRIGDKPQARKVLEYTRQSADHLMTVINDVLDHSLISTDRLLANPETFALRKTVQAAFEMFRPQVENTSLDYTCEIDADVPEWVHADRHRLMQVLVNLLGNAIKFTHQGSVSLRVRCTPEGVEFSVTDTGIGMTAEQQTGIFERYRQADPGIQGRYGGNGLGLAISDRLALMMGGELGMHSQPGEGSCFWLRLPLRAAEAPQAARVPEQESALAQASDQALRFLVVDDHPVNRLLVRQVLQRHWPQAEIVEVDDGAKALLACEHGAPWDAVLMDMVMPVMDGIEATKGIRASPRDAVRRTPVLGLTANVNPQDLAHFEKVGLDALLLKPFEPARLLGEVERLLPLGKVAQQP